MGTFLTKEQRKFLEKTYKQVKEKKLGIRILCILALDSGYTYEQVRKILLIDDATISEYKRRFLEGGLEKLLEINYKGYEGKLTSAQEEELKCDLIDKIARSAKEVVEFVKQKYAVEYTENGMIYLLHRLGFVYKKTKMVPSKACAEKQRLFVEEYKKLKQIKQEKDKIYFIDATHPTHNSEPCYGWIYKGKEKATLTNSGRKRLNIIGALDPETHQVIHQEEDVINSCSVINLLKKIEEKNPQAQNIFIIADNARYYKSKIVREYIKNNPKIQIKSLPPYSPNLNLVERLWKFFKNKVIKGRFYEKFEAFRQSIRDFFNSIYKYKDELAKLLTENFHIIPDDS